MKTIIVLMLVLSMMFSFVACGKKETVVVDTTPTDTDVSGEVSSEDISTDVSLPESVVSNNSSMSVNSSEPSKAVNASKPSESISSTESVSSGGKTDTTEAIKHNGFYGLTQKEADKFAPLLDGLFTGKTAEQITNNDLGKEFGMHFPDLIYLNNTYYAYYITYATKTNKGGVGLATSTDGLKWENHGCVIEPSEEYDINGAYFAGVWLDTDNKIYLVYECKGGENTSYGTLENVALAVSKDGKNFTKEGVILYKDTSLYWQKANVGTPDLYKVGDTWYVTFHGFDFTDCYMGLAYGTDLHNLTMVKEPIISTKDGTAYSGTAGRRDVIYVGGYYYMVFEVSTDAVPPSGYGAAKWTHMFARSKNMMDWEVIKEPLLKQTKADGSDKTGFGYDGPCWCVIDGELCVLMRNTSNCTSIVKLISK